MMTANLFKASSTQTINSCDSLSCSSHKSAQIINLISVLGFPDVLKSPEFIYNKQRN